MISEFELREKVYRKLLKQFNAGKLSAENFKAAIRELQLKDHQGRLWSLGMESGDWHLYDEKAWIKKDPHAEFCANSTAHGDMKAHFFTSLTRGNRFFRLFPSSFLLVLMNVIPILGVLFLSWKVEVILFLYWLENLFIGFIHLYRIRKAIGPFPSNMDIKTGEIKKDPPWLRRKITKLMGFIYFVFSIGHGLFILILIGFPFQRFSELIPALILLLLPHLFSLFYHFVYHREYETVSYQELLFAPLQRTIVLHFVILIFGFILFESELDSMPLLLFMVVLKLSIDLWKHLGAHLKFFPKHMKGESETVIFKPVNHERYLVIGSGVCLTLAIAFLFIALPGALIFLLPVTLMLVLVFIVSLSYYRKNQSRRTNVQFKLPFGCGFTGSWLSGTLRIDRLNFKLTQITYRFSCGGYELEYSESKHQKSGGAKGKTLWRCDKEIPEIIICNVDEPVFPIAFRIPHHLPPSISGRSLANISWRLKADLEGVDTNHKTVNLQLIFPAIPIFKPN